MKLLDYIRGSRKGKEAHRIEREAMQDPFFADAIEGFDTVKGNHIERIETLQKQIAGYRKKQNYAMYWSIAASLLLVISIGGYFLWQEDTPDGQLYTQALDSIQTNPELYPPKKLKIEEYPKQEITTSKTNPIIIHEVETAPVADEVESKMISIKEIRTEPMAMTSHLNFEDTGSMGYGDLIIPNKDIEGKLAGISVKPLDGLTDKSMDPFASISADDQLKLRYDYTAGKIKGRISDENGEPIIGASILIKDTNQGTVSDVHGNFELQADGTKNIVVQYIGYQTANIPVSASKSMDIYMKPDNLALEEVVVIGYGAKSKKTITGAVSSIKLSKEDSKPESINGEKAFEEYIKNNLVRPTDEACKDVKGKVELTFYVDSTGRPIHITVKKALCPTADAEAIRLLQEGPDWTTGNKEAKVSIKF